VDGYGRLHSYQNPGKLMGARDVGHDGRVGPQAWECPARVALMASSGAGFDKWYEPAGGCLEGGPRQQFR
jgi:hypothetical protein